MVSDEWDNNPRNLEKSLGFILDCPRCRAWNLLHYCTKQLIHIKCSQCGLEIMIPPRSLVYQSGVPLPVIL